jgi:hypothetical protein
MVHHMRATPKHCSLSIMQLPLLGPTHTGSYREEGLTMMTCDDQY